jgi:hypothetical protein
MELRARSGLDEAQHRHGAGYTGPKTPADSKRLPTTLVPRGVGSSVDRRNSLTLKWN